MVPNSSLCPTHWELPTHCSPKFPLKLIKTSPPASTRTTPPVCLTSTLGVGECEANKTHIKSMVSRDLTSILRCQTVIFRSTYQGLYICVYIYTYILYTIITSTLCHMVVISYHLFCPRISFHFVIGVLGCPGRSTLFGCVQNHIRSFACWMMIRNPLYVSGPPTKIQEGSTSTAQQRVACLVGWWITNQCLTQTLSARHFESSTRNSTTKTNLCKQ